MCFVLNSSTYPIYSRAYPPSSISTDQKTIAIESLLEICLDWITLLDIWRSDIQARW